MHLTLPYPPTVNHYWQRNRNGSVRISSEGTAYRQNVQAILLAARVKQLSCPLDVSIVAHPPDRRRRDLDNLNKALLDALQHGGAYEDDNQICRLTIERGEKVEGGCVVVTIRRYQERKAG